MTIAECNANPLTWLVSTDAGQVIGMIELHSHGVFMAAVGVKAEARPIGLADDLDAAAGEIERIHQAQHEINLAIFRGRTGRAIPS